MCAVLHATRRANCRESPQVGTTLGSPMVRSSAGLCARAEPAWRATHVPVHRWSRERGGVSSALSGLADVLRGPLATREAAADLLRQIYGDVPLSTRAGAVVHVAAAWERQDGSLVRHTRGSSTTPGCRRRRLTHWRLHARP